MASIIAKILVPITGKLLELVLGLIVKAFNDWLDEKKQDETDRRVKREIKNPDRRTAAGDLDRSFDG